MYTHKYKKMMSGEIDTKLYTPSLSQFPIGLASYCLCGLQFYGMDLPLHLRSVGDVADPWVNLRRLLYDAVSV
jgi:hypothetical protein